MRPICFTIHPPRHGRVELIQFYNRSLRIVNSMPSQDYADPQIRSLHKTRIGPNNIGMMGPFWQADARASLSGSYATSVSWSSHDAVLLKSESRSHKDRLIHYSATQPTQNTMLDEQRKFVILILQQTLAFTSRQIRECSSISMHSQYFSGFSRMKSFIIHL